MTTPTGNYGLRTSKVIPFARSFARYYFSSNFLLRRFSTFISAFKDATFIPQNPSRTCWRPHRNLHLPPTFSPIYFHVLSGVSLFLFLLNLSLRWQNDLLMISSSTGGVCQFLPSVLYTSSWFILSPISVMVRIQSNMQNKRGRKESFECSPWPVSTWY